MKLRIVAHLERRSVKAMRDLGGFERSLVVSWGRT
jgi:hypothetical protein